MEELAQLGIEKIKAEKCKRDFLYFFKDFWNVIVPEELVLNWHIEYLCSEMQKVGEKIINKERKDYDLIINISPGTSKSTIASVMFPVWLWIKDPTMRTITGSHSSSLSIDLSVKSRDIIQSEKFQKYFPDIKLKPDNNNKSYYINTKGGSRATTSVGSKIIGKHAHCIIVDDPVSANPSDAELETANRWITSDLATRKVDKSTTPTILIMQRVHDNDPTAHILRQNSKVKQICLPAELTSDVQPPELKARYENNLMDPKRLTRETLQEMKAALGSYGFASQFLQNPAPEDGGIIKKEWLESVHFSEELKKKLERIPTNFYIDSAYTNDKGNDPSAITAVKKKGNILYIIKSAEKWLEFPELISFIKTFVNNNGYSSRSKIYIEPKASGKSIVQTLKQTEFNVIESKAPTDSKLTRLKAVSPKFEAGKVVFIEDRCNEKQFSQLVNVKAAHDDVRDTIVMAVEKELITAKKGTYYIR